jgi:hypothetical protein
VAASSIIGIVSLALSGAGVLFGAGNIHPELPDPAQALMRELSLYRKCTLAAQKSCANAAKSELIVLSSQCPDSASAFLPAVWSARTDFELSLAIALVRRELEPK